MGFGFKARICVAKLLRLYVSQLLSSFRQDRLTRHLAMTYRICTQQIKGISEQLQMLSTTVSMKQAREYFGCRNDIVWYSIAVRQLACPIA